MSEDAYMEPSEDVPSENNTKMSHLSESRERQLLPKDK